MWWLAPAITAVTGLAGQLISNRSARKEYDKMREYNTPANQMKRFTDAGLSPYLMYGQGNPGNMTAPAPAQETGIEHIGASAGQALENYMAYSNFDVNQRLMRAQLRGMEIDNVTKEWKQSDVFASQLKKQLELLSDYPDLDISRAETDRVATGFSTGFRRKVNELKMQASKAQIDRIETAINSMKVKTDIDRSKNIVERVKAMYAQDYGMVGGDWTQGMGLLRSLGSFFKGSRGVRSTLPQGRFNQKAKPSPDWFYNSPRRTPWPNPY